jgi:hypothetical protein
LVVSQQGLGDCSVAMCPQYSSGCPGRAHHLPMHSYPLTNFPISLPTGAHWGQLCPGNTAPFGGAGNCAHPQLLDVSGMFIEWMNEDFLIKAPYCSEKIHGLDCPQGGVRALRMVRAVASLRERLCLMPSCPVSSPGSSLPPSGDSGFPPSS